MIQKIIKVGSSLAVTIPKKSIKELGFKAGGNVNVHIDTDKKQVTIKAENTSRAELENWTDQFIDEYKTVLKNLADR